MDWALWILVGLIAGLTLRVPRRQERCDVRPALPVRRVARVRR